MCFSLRARRWTFSRTRSRPGPQRTLVRRLRPGAVMTAGARRRGSGERACSRGRMHHRYLRHFTGLEMEPHGSSPISCPGGRHARPPGHAGADPRGAIFWGLCEG
eukprot:scaffold153_cov314-Prasinococcus_capsulatus_cf.AAC.8